MKLITVVNGLVRRAVFSSPCAMRVLTKGCLSWRFVRRGKRQQYPLMQPRPRGPPEPEPGPADPLASASDVVDDPLSSSAAELDPLSAAAAEARGADTFGAASTEGNQDYEEGFTPWSARRDAILTDYQTDKTITIANLKNIDNTDDAACNGREGLGHRRERAGWTSWKTRRQKVSATCCC